MLAWRKHCLSYQFGLVEDGSNLRHIWGPRRQILLFLCETWSFGPNGDGVSQSSSIPKRSNVQAYLRSNSISLMATRRFSHQNAPMLCKRTHVLTILSVTLTVVWLRLYIWSAGEVPISESYETHNTNDIEEEWEWARDVSIVYTWVVSRFMSQIWGFPLPLLIDDRPLGRLP